MMHFDKRLVLTTLASLLWAGDGLPYEVLVHRGLTNAAFDQAYPDPNHLLEPLGITPGQTFSGRAPRDWIAQGALDEDSILSLPPRSPRHFLNPTVSPGGLVYGIWAFTSAPDWAFNTDGLNPTYSIPGARQALFDALTTKDEIKRPKFWADAFEALGRVVHLIQDMAQPQHVRNDAHLTFGPTSDIVLRRFSRYERYADEQARNSLLAFTGYPTVDLPAYRKYWKEHVGTALNGRGLAEFSNRYFVTQNTNFDKVSGQQGYFQWPALSETAPVEDELEEAKDYRGNPILDPNGVPYTNVKVRYHSINFTDAYTGASGVNPKLATYSFFDFISAANNGKNVYSMDNEVFGSMAQILIPRAVGYSAGLIRYFFRGKLEINPPAEGVYALVDHSQPDVHTKDTGGFTKLKAKVRNITPGPVSQGQPTIDPMSSAGALRAVVKFRRNVCYEPQRLLGRPGGPTYGAGCKSTVEEVVVSDSVAPNAAEINSGSGQTVSFDFRGQEVIPINATDVSLQVVYRGQLGEETDAVVVSAKNISEPSFYNFDNYSDCYRDANGTYSTVAGVPLTASMSFNDGLSYIASVVNLPPGRYARYAVLADHDTVSTKEQSGLSYGYQTVVNQDVSGVPITTSINRARPTSVPPGGLDDYMYAYDGFGYYPAPTYAGAHGCLTPVNPVPMQMNIVFQ